MKQSTEDGIFIVVMIIAFTILGFQFGWKVGWGFGLLYWQFIKVWKCRQ